MNRRGVSADGTDIQFAEGCGVSTKETLTEQERYEQADLPFYEKHIAPVLPAEVLDFHAHAWTSHHWKEIPWEKGQPGAAYMVTQTDYSAEHLIADGRRLFPGRSYKAVCFGNPTPAADLGRTNDYACEIGRMAGMFPLIVVGKGIVQREEILRRLRQERIFGYKIHLNWFGDNYAGVGVEDMIGPGEMEIADEQRLIVMLHVPGAGRLADPKVQKGVQELSRSYPNAQIVLAHCGRCYLPDEMRDAIGAIADLENVWMDTSMVMDPMVLETAFKAIGSRRVLFATDLPVAMMRGRRVYVMDHWVDLVLPAQPESNYRVQSGDMRATFMAYEIVLAVRRAAEQARLSEAELRGVFHDNGMALIERVKNRQ